MRNYINFSEVQPIFETASRLKDTKKTSAIFTDNGGCGINTMKLINDIKTIPSSFFLLPSQL
jgi:hypothetical protein